jgi:hypothetical protein
MPFQSAQYAEDRISRQELSRRLALVGLMLAGGAAIGLAARWRRQHNTIDESDFDLTDAQAITVKAPLEIVEAGWIDWCASGHARLKTDYAVRFEPAPGARGTEVHLSARGTTGTIRDELRRFKQRLETGEILKSDGPGLSRPAQPRNAAQADALTEVR